MARRGVVGAAVVSGAGVGVGGLAVAGGVAVAGVAGGYFVANREGERKLRAQQKASDRKLLTEKNIRYRSNVTRLESLERNIAMKKDSLNELEEESRRLKKNLDAEKAAQEQFELPPGCVFSDSELKKIVLIGETGCGKSTLGNRLCGDESKLGDKGPFVARRSIRSVTGNINIQFRDNVNMSFCVVDTPGINSSDHQDRNHHNKLVKLLHGIGSVDAFVFVRRVTDCRLTGGEQKLLKDLQEILAGENGEKFWKNVVLVLTRVEGEYAESEFETMKNELPRALGEDVEVDLDVMDAIPIVGIGMKNFRKKIVDICRHVARCNGGQPFESNQLVAPVEQLQAEYEVHKGIVHERKKEIQHLQAEFKDLRKQVLKLWNEIQRLHASVSLERQ